MHPKDSIALVFTAIGPSGTFDVAWDSVIADEVRKCAAKPGMDGERTIAVGATRMRR